MSNCADWGYPGEFLTIPFEHEVEYCREEFGDGFFNVFHTSKGKRVTRFVPKDIATIVLMVETDNPHDVFVINANVIDYDHYLEDQILELKSNPQDLDTESFQTRLKRIASEHVFCKQLRQDYISQISIQTL